MISQLNFFKKKILILLIFFINISSINADIIKEIQIEGNQRLSVETVIMFSGLDLNDEVDNDDLNISIKELYKTNYFKIRFY